MKDINKLMTTLPPPTLVEDCFGLLKLYSDETIYRSNDINPLKLSLNDDHYTDSIIYKDTLFDETNNLYLRLYKPTTISSSQKMPILFYFHGGGFCFQSSKYPRSHNLCLRLALDLQGLVISCDYRLAPEHRLPAAMEDAFNALKWVQGEAKSDGGFEGWLRDKVVDFDNVLVVGDSSGGNIAHHLAVQLGPGSMELAPVRIRGYVLLSPFFGGTERTKREQERPFESFWTQDHFDQFWRLAIPLGGDKDHFLVNPFGKSNPSLKDVAMDPILVIIGGDELLSDRAIDYVTRLKELKKKAEIVVFEEKEHGFFTHYPLSKLATDALEIIKSFCARIQ